MVKCVHGIDSRFCARCTRPSASARRDAIERRASALNPQTVIEREAFEAVCAYEEAASKLKGRQVRASRTWRMIDQKGVVAALEGIVTRKQETPAFRVLVEMNLLEKSFEAVVARHKDSFSDEAVAAAAARLLRA